MTHHCSHTDLAAEEMAGLVIIPLPGYDHKKYFVRRQIMCCVPFTHARIVATLDGTCKNLAAEVKCDRIKIWPQLENGVSIPVVDAVSLCIVHNASIFLVVLFPC